MSADFETSFKNPSYVHFCERAKDSSPILLGGALVKLVGMGGWLDWYFGVGMNVFMGWCVDRLGGGGAATLLKGYVAWISFVDGRYLEISDDDDNYYTVAAQCAFTVSEWQA